MSLLNNGLQHSIEKPLEKYWTDLIMETEQAIRMLKRKMQSPYKILATRKLKQMKTSSSHHNADAKRQTDILININNKLRKEDATITKADKYCQSCILLVLYIIEHYLRCVLRICPSMRMRIFSDTFIG
jgi:hypothetical protein